MRDRNNDTPLMCAIEFGHDEVIKALIECGAHIQVTWDFCLILTFKLGLFYKLNPAEDYRSLYLDISFYSGHFLHSNGS